MNKKIYNIMEVTSNAIRGCIIAPPGKKLVVADLSNIEGRYAAWVAGESWKLESFRAYDHHLLDKFGDKIPDGKGDYLREGPDLYKLAYAKAFNIRPEDVTPPQRQIGKVMELMLQYEGGVGAFLTGAATYNTDLAELAKIAWPLIPPRVKKDAIEFWAWTIKKRRSTFDLPQKVFCTCDALKRMWREAHPAISSYWPELKEAFATVTERGGSVQCRKLIFRKDGVWLRIIMPSGRALCYPSPKVEKGQCSYMGVNPYSRQWCRIKTYGGKLFENVVQAGARDVFKGTDMRPGANLPSTLHMIEEAGFNILLPVHDELICEAPDTDEFTSERLAELMTSAPSWADGLPLAAGGFECKRYRKG